MFDLTPFIPISLIRRRKGEVLTASKPVFSIASVVDMGNPRFNIRRQLVLESKQYRLAKRMRWAARVIGLGAAVFFLTMLIGAAIAEVLTDSLEPVTIGGALLGILGAMALAGCIVSWWRERLAGILLVLTSIGLGIHIGFYAGRNHFLAWSMMGLPYLVAGVLLLGSWQLSRKTL